MAAQEYSDTNFPFLEGKIPKRILQFNVIFGIFYFLVIAFIFPAGNKILFGILVASEIFHLWMAITFWFTVWDLDYEEKTTLDQPPVDVFITICGEPAEIVRQTVTAALFMNYPSFKIYLLNDGRSANKANWKEIVLLAKELGVGCITRTKSGGAKAGNINHALKLTHSPFVAVFDADHVPHADFLQKSMANFHNDRIGFVQSPQFYKNHDLNLVTQAAWEQQALFFGPVCRGKNRMNAMFLCGTNMVLRRQALEDIGGMTEDSIAEDFLTSVFIHQRGWKSVYIPEILAEGLAPEDLHAYSLQQYRWARGSLEMLLWHNPLFMKNLTWRQKIQYLASASYWINGLVVALNAIFPLVFFFFNQAPFTASTMFLALVFLPYIFLTFYTLSLSTNFSVTAQALAFSLGCFPIHIKALLASIFRVKQKFAVTPKQGSTQAFFSLAWMQFGYIALSFIGAAYAIWREGLTASVASNVAWAGFNSLIFAYFVAASLPQTNLIMESKNPLKVPVQN